MQRWRRDAWVVCVSSLMALGALNEGIAQRSLDSKIVEVSLFKNGLAYVLREVEAPGAGDYVLETLPAPVHGSFSILPTSKETVIKEAVAFSRPRIEKAVAMGLLDLLRANEGKRVRLKLKDSGWVEGTIVSVPEAKTGLPRSRPARSRNWNYYDDGGYSSAYRPPSGDTAANDRSPEFIVLRIETGATQPSQAGTTTSLTAGQLAVLPSQIEGVQGTEGLTLALGRSVPGAALKLKVAGVGGRLQITYLEGGLTWAPSYVVDLVSPEEASLRCKAEILNDVEDLEGSTVNFITGYPNLAFAEAVDPLALVGDVSDFLQSLMSLPGRHQRQPPVVAQQAVMANVATGPPGRTAYQPTSEGEAREDLFFYPRTQVTLARGERGYYPLFEKRIPCESLYRWQIEDSLDEQNRWRYYYGYYDRGDRNMPEQEEIWHTLRLTNVGGIPWTTAPALVTQAGRVLGQDTLFYTAPGAKTLLKVTRAVDVWAQQAEKEINRMRNAPTEYHHGEFDLVTIKGELRVFNQRSKPIRLLIEKELSGELLDASPKAETATTAQGVWRVNPKQKLTWEAPLNANGKLYVTYQYKVYAAR